MVLTVPERETWVISSLLCYSALFKIFKMTVCQFYKANRNFLKVCKQLNQDVNIVVHAEW